MCCHNLFQFRLAPPPAEMIAAAHGRFTVTGSVNTTALLSGKPAEMRRQEAKNLAAGMRLSGPAAQVVPKPSNANLRAIAEPISG